MQVSTKVVEWENESLNKKSPNMVTFGDKNIRPYFYEIGYNACYCCTKDYIKQ